MYHFGFYADLALPADSTRRRFLCRKYLGSIKKVPSPEQGFIWMFGPQQTFQKNHVGMERMEPTQDWR
jgi:hypothetical protein